MRRRMREFEVVTEYGPARPPVFQDRYSECSDKELFRSFDYELEDCPEYGPWL